MSDKRDRRSFLKGLGVVGASVVSLPPVEAVAAPAAEPQTPAAAAPATATAVSHAYSFLTPPEAAFLEAAVNQFIPADDLTPNGTDCGVVVFMDRQFGGAWGAGDRMYMSGPWQKGKPTQGYQLPLTPAELLRAGVAATNAYCRTTYQKDFDRITHDQQITVLQSLEQGKIELGEIPAGEFFTLLLNTTMEGFFADPIYGGNRNKVAWKMVGFPGVIAIHSTNIKTYRNKRYEAPATSIEDLS
jgi:gluconate 2-dehydrogenase gamma chain